MTNTRKTAILLLFFVGILFCIPSYGNTAYKQVAQISLKLKNKTVEEFCNAIEKQTEFVFFFYEGLVSEQTKINVSVTNSDICTVLDEALKGTGISYAIDDRQVFLKKQEEKIHVTPPQPSQQPQQLQKITGVVVDDIGEPLAGVNILVAGSTRGVSTDIDGSFSIEVKPTDQLIFSFLGMEDQTISVQNKQKLHVVMKERSDMLEEVTVVAFAKQKKESVISSITTVKPKELKVPSSNLTTALAGRVAGLISYQRSGEPGQDNANFFIRGVTTFGYKADPLILIDGVELTANDLARLQPDDIESFSIMKDATSSALYGARGANGVILVTTKEGQESKLKIAARFENTISTPARNIKIADPITYMLKHNEAVSTRDPLASLPYSQEKIDNTIAGTNKYVYPAVDWYDMLFKNQTTNQRFNMSLSGGGKIARYYVAMTYNHDNGILNVDKQNNFNSNISLDKISVRSNININLTNTTELITRMSGTFDDYSGPLNGGTDMFNRVMRANPVKFPAYYAKDVNNTYTNHILFGNAETGNYINPYADMVKGYKEYSQTLMNAQIELKQQLDFITEGLNFRVMANTTRTSYFDVSRYYKPYYYVVDRYDRRENTYILKNINENSATEWLDYDEGGKTINSSFYLETVLQYDKTFNDKHTIGGLLVYTMKNSLDANSGSLQKSLPYRNMGLAGRATYGYDNRYFIEGNFGYNGSERFAKSHRFGFFPSGGLGWMVSNEQFFSSLKSYVTQLKFKATYGLVGNDAIGDSSDRFFYLSEVNMNSGTSSGFGTNFNSPTNRPTVSIGRYANDKITWEVSRKLNVGLEAVFFEDFTFQIDYFKEHRNNILMDRSAITPEMGLEAAVRANVGKAEGSGFDASLDYNKYFQSGLVLTGRANFTYATSKFKVYEEPFYADAPWRSRIGRSLAQEWGYVAERLFIDEEDVANSPKQFGEYGAGDIKYRDINNDGIINENDRVPIGHPTSPEIIYGFGLSASYKNFDMSCFFQGSARSSFWIDQTRTAPFVDTDGDGSVVSNNALLSVYANDHWSETNQNIYALWPRLSNHLVENNNQRSTWFMRDGSFLRLKQLELGYTLPDWTKKAYISSARIYLSGTNLLTFSNFKLWDPEMAGNGLGYPIQRTYNVGIQVNF